VSDRPSYIVRKKNHMKNILGIEVGTGKYGGASPKWLDEAREADEDRQMERVRRRQASKELVDAEYE
jgi:hypothetical protein